MLSSSSDGTQWPHHLAVYYNCYSNPDLHYTE